MVRQRGGPSRDSNHAWVVSIVTGGCRLQDRDGQPSPCVHERGTYPVFGLPYLPKYAALGIDLFFLACLISECACSIVAQGAHRYAAANYMGLIKWD